MMDVELEKSNESEFQKKSFTIADDILNDMNASFNTHLTGVSPGVRAQAVERISGVILWTWINLMRQMGADEDKIKAAVSYLVNFSLTQHVLADDAKESDKDSE